MGIKKTETNDPDLACLKFIYWITRSSTFHKCSNNSTKQISVEQKQMPLHQKYQI